MARIKKHRHYRPPGTKKEDNPDRYMTGSQAVKQLQVTLPLFRRLCVLKGIFPRESKKKVKGSNRPYYHVKDIAFLQSEPLLEKFSGISAYQKKISRALTKKNADLATLLLGHQPTAKLRQAHHPKEGENYTSVFNQES